jgi:glycosyltransferase involved in cell wall biosynthesis
VASPVRQDRPFQVLMTADAVGGVWQYSLDLAQALRPHGVEVTIAVLGPDPTSAQQQAAARGGIALELTGLPLDWTARSTEEVEEASRAIAGIAEAFKPDLVHLNSPALAAGTRFAVPVVAVAHSCVATWWRAVREGPLPQEFVWRTDLVRRGYLGADAVLAPTSAFAQATEQAYQLPTKPIVVSNGRRASFAAPRSEPADFVFTAGRLWDDGKNLATLDRAAARIAAPVLAAGPLRGPNGAQIALRHTKTLGPLDDTGVVEQLARRPIFVSLARYEPFGLAVLEAAQAGCALVLADIPTFRELWDGAAAFVPAQDDEAAAQTTERLLRDPDARHRLGALARERASTYSIEAMSAGVLAVYRSLAAKGLRGRTPKEAAA